MQKIDLVDTTFRDGQQSPLLFDTSKYKFSLEERKLIIKGLLSLGVNYFEFFSPIVGKVEESYFRKIKKYVNSKLNYNPIYIAHCRCSEQDIDMAINSGFNGLNLYFGTSDKSIQYNHGKSIVEIANIARSIIKKYKTKNPKLYIRFSGEDAFRTDLKDLFYVYDSLSDLVNTFGMPDTVGCATPDKVKKVTTALKKRYPNNDLETHFHNDRGFALINTITAIKCGARYIDTSVWGLAERSGISSTTGTLLNAYLENKDYVAGYNLALCYPINVLMASILNMQVPYNEPVSLTNRTHIAGVHTGAVVKNPQAYENIDLSIFGVNKKQLLLGPLSGWNIIHYYLNEVLYFKSSPDQSKEIAIAFKKLSFHANKFNNPEEILKDLGNINKLKKIIIKKDSKLTRIENLS